MKYIKATVTIGNGTETKTEFFFSTDAATEFAVSELRKVFPADLNLERDICEFGFASSDDWFVKVATEKTKMKTKRETIAGRMADMLEHIVTSAELLGFGTDEPIQGSDCVDMVNEWFEQARTLQAEWYECDPSVPENECPNCAE